MLMRRIRNTIILIKKSKIRRISMKTLVTYYSQTENTKKIADAIYKEFNVEKKEMLLLKEVKDLAEYELTLVGFPIHKFGVPEKVGDFLKNNVSGKKIALFITHAMPSDSDALKTVLQNCKEAASGADLLGVFHCRGELSEKIAKIMMKNDDPNVKNFANMREATIGHPNSSEISEAKLFARSIFSKL